MKVFTFFVSLILFMTGSIYAQKSSATLAKEIVHKTFALDGTPFLREKDEEVAKYISNNPDMFSNMKLKKTTSWNFKVGDKKSWYSYNFVTKKNYSVSSTLRAIGPHSYIFVEDSLWNKRVDSAAVDSILNAFEYKTPANSSEGVYQTDVNYFGNPPDVDNDPRIIILILNIQDGYKGSGGYVGGYFSSYNETNQSQSNEAEIIYIDANPQNLMSYSGLRGAMSTTAHEFQHMINWNYRQGLAPQMTFINEGLSLLAEVDCGYPLYSQSFYTNEPNYYLFGWRTNDMTKVLNDYSRAARFFLYLRDQFGIGFSKKIVDSKLYGVAALNDALTRDAQTIRFKQVFINWLIANELNDKNVNPAYGYTYPNLIKPKNKTYYNPNVSYSGNLYNLAGEYFSFTNGSKLKIKFDDASSKIIIKAIETGSTTTKVIDVPTNTQFSEPNYGTTYKSINFVVIDTSQSNSENYSFTASGNAPVKSYVLKWDNGNPVGYLVLSPSDTVAVTFDAYPDGKLDSVRVALRRAGSITGGVWEYSGQLRPTPLGKVLAAPITASTNLTPPYPYPVPYNNWASIDLRSYSIKTDNPFVVGFIIGSDPRTPAVMSTDYPGQSPFHSYTFLHKPSSGTPNWYYLTSSDSTIAIYLVRAYVTINTTGVKQEIELAPKSFVLTQNYPNPFNPTTTINFVLPKSEVVIIKVYNQLGQQVAQLGNRKYGPGSHSLNFNASQLSSGVYYYRIQAGTFIKTKKMILLK